MSKGLDWRRARSPRDTQSIADDDADFRHLGLGGRPRKAPPSKASLRALAEEAVKEFTARQAARPKPDQDEVRPPWEP